MHIFLTGAVGCGKSTVIDKILARLDCSVGGFRSGFGPDRACPDRFLYLWDAGGPPRYDEEHAVVRFTGGIPRPMPPRFDALGIPLLERPCGVLVMDECGRLEREALGFQRAVLDALDRETSVLGVVREGFPGWTGAIAGHPSVELITVTAENRDGLPETLAERLTL